MKYECSEERKRRTLTLNHLYFSVVACNIQASTMNLKDGYTVTIRMPLTGQAYSFSGNSLMIHCIAFTLAGSSATWKDIIPFHYMPQVLPSHQCSATFAWKCI